MEDGCLPSAYIRSRLLFLDMSTDKQTYEHFRGTASHIFYIEETIKKIISLFERM